MHRAPSRRRRPHVAGTANHAWLLGCLFVVLLLCVRGEDGVCAGAAGGREVRVAFVHHALHMGGVERQIELTRLLDQSEQIRANHLSSEPERRLHSASLDQLDQEINGDFWEQVFP